MSKRSFFIAFGIGLAAVLWVAAGFVGTSWLALAISVAIAGTYLLGGFELLQFRRGTAALAAAVGDGSQPASLDAWLANVPATLRHAVRLRIEGERGGGLPGPALTPYLVGLLVMLGMLGTFLGMVITFQGAVFALEGSTDLQAIRSALAAPLKGLGLSFGTSVAGVATSAMLGLMSAIARRERVEVARRLDERIAGVLLPFSLVHQRQETFRALQAQARALPDVGEQLAAVMERIEQRAQQLDARLLERHDALQAGIEKRGRQVDTDLLQRAEALHASFEQRSQQLDARLLERHEALQAGIERAYGELAQRVGDSLQASLAAGARSAGESITPVVEAAMRRMGADAQRLHERLQEASARQLDAFAQQFTALREADLQRAGEAAAQLGELRQELAAVAERENGALQERAGLLQRFEAMLQSVNDATGGQRAAIEAMVASAANTMQESANRFAQVLDAQSAKATEAATQVGGSALEVASLAQAFNEAVQQFRAGSEQLAESLQRVEASLERSTARSDEQLAYYVAQAREVIDLSISSQQAVLEGMRRLDAPPAKVRA